MLIDRFSHESTDCVRNAVGVFSFLMNSPAFQTDGVCYQKRIILSGCMIHTFALHTPVVQSLQVFIHAFTSPPLRWITSFLFLLFLRLFTTLPGRLLQQQHKLQYIAVKFKKCISMKVFGFLPRSHHPKLLQSFIKLFYTISVFFQNCTEVHDRKGCAYSDSVRHACRINGSRQTNKVLL